MMAPTAPKAAALFTLSEKAQVPRWIRARAPLRASAAIPEVSQSVLTVAPGRSPAYSIVPVIAEVNCPVPLSNAGGW